MRSSSSEVSAHLFAFIRHTNLCMLEHKRQVQDVTTLPSVVSRAVPRRHDKPSIRWQQLLCDLTACIPLHASTCQHRLHRNTLSVSVFSYPMPANSNDGPFHHRRGLTWSFCLQLVFQEKLHFRFFLYNFVTSTWVPFPPFVLHISPIIIIRRAVNCAGLSAANTHNFHLAIVCHHVRHEGFLPTFKQCVKDFRFYSLWRTVSILI